MVRPSLIGNVIDEVSFPVERGKVREFSVAAHDSNPIYFDPVAARAAGYADIPAPLTYAVVAMHWRERGVEALPAALGLDVGRVVHGEASWEYFGPVCVGDELHGVRRVVDVAVREGRRGGRMTIVELETDFNNQKGELVIRQRDRIIERA